MTRDKNFDLGDFFGSAGGASSVPASESRKTCPFLEKNSYCGLDGTLCPFVGFDYRKCKKYINNIAKGRNIDTTGVDNSQKKKVNGPTENLIEAKSDENDWLSAIFDIQQYVDSFDVDPNANNKDFRDITVSSFFDALHDKTLTTAQAKALKDKENFKSLIKAYLKHQHDVTIDDADQNTWDQFLDSIFNVLHTEKLQQHLPQSEKDTGYSDPFKEARDRAAKVDADAAKEDPPPDLDPEMFISDRETKASKASSRKRRSADSSRNRSKREKKQSSGSRKVGGTSIPKKNPPIKRTGVPAKRTWARAAFPSTERQMSATQFDTWFDDRWGKLPHHVKKTILKRSPDYRTPADIKDTVKKLEKSNDRYEIKRLQKLLADRFDDFVKTENFQKQVEYQIDKHADLVKKMNWATPQEIAAMRKDPRNLNKAEKMLNGAMSKLVKYDYQLRKIPGGGKDDKILVPIQQSLIPKFTQEDYAVQRMAEQMGLLAIQKQHRYGPEYGKYNARNLFIKQVVMPIVLLAIGAPSLIQPLARIFPQAWLDARWFAKPEQQMPTLQTHGSSYKELRNPTPKLAKDDRTAASARFAHQPSLMRGFEQNLLLPPGKDVMHSRYLPTTKKKWSRIKAQRYKQAAQKRQQSPVDWRKSYLPR